jgi:hypothetical protein
VDGLVVDTSHLDDNLQAAVEAAAGGPMLAVDLQAEDSESPTLGTRISNFFGMRNSAAHYRQLTRFWRRLE